MKVVDKKFDITWMYLSCFIFVDTAFLLCMIGLIYVTDVTQTDLVISRTQEQGRATKYQRSPEMMNKELYICI